MPIMVGTAGELGITAKDIGGFYTKHWLKQTALCNPKFYDWQFINNSSNTGIDECCVAIDDNEIIGVMGVNARDFYLKNKKRKGVELTTWIISEAYRGRGVGVSMVEHLKNNYEVIVGMGVSQSALPIYLQNGFRFIRAIPRHIHVINWDIVSPFIECSPLAHKYFKSQFTIQDFSISETLWNKVDDIFNLFKERHNTLSRYSKDAIWRFDQHPIFNYSHFIVNDTCFVVVRIDKDIKGFVMAHCVDIIGDDTHYSSAISAAIDFAKGKGADAIDFFATNTRLNSALGACGLFSTLDHDFFTFPHLFHPIEHRNPATTSLILWTNDNLDDLLDLGRLHITKQDVDFDRPTLCETYNE